MRKRFKSLNAALKYLNPSGTAGDDFNGEAPINSQLRMYQDWRSGKREVEYGPRDSASKPGRLRRVAIQPFALESTDPERAIVKYSLRANNGLTTAGLTSIILGHELIDDDADVTEGFEPARVTVAVAGTGASVPDTSKITGRKYDRKTGVRSYTFPFGQAGTDDRYREAKSAILVAVTADNAPRTASFSPEIYR